MLQLGLQNEWANIQPFKMELALSDEREIFLAAIGVGENPSEKDLGAELGVLLQGNQILLMLRLFWDYLGY